ncbi:AraC family transcriptional regulator [Aquimarina aggregata]|uniref:AraC family transcriptional regulator n=1 Tax=Aquimarina aggregata TaxID=1642818 RepID=A0A162FAM3_9FLAO|nr:AraC family transcriptional regulator [Aquimarina aggregata]KZS40356.1 AraC family transcriptional regulator [Aquimarina aggregata]
MVSEEYIGRINIILRFIDNNLDNQLSLEKIAEKASYSPFHFHRIFKAITGEPLNAYIIRKRIEKTAGILIRQKGARVSELSLQYGFSSNSSFTRAFKKVYGISPSEFRKLSPGKYSKICKVESKNGQENQIFEKYICNINNQITWIKMNAKIEIKEFLETDIAYVTQIGVEGIEQAFDKVLRWGRSKGMLENSNTKIARIFHDSFKITDPDKVRMSICMFLDKEMKAEGEIGMDSIAGGKHIVSRFEITVEEFEKSWSGLFIWMNENGYQKSAHDPFEIYHNNFNDHPEKKCIVDFCIPIK